MRRSISNDFNLEVARGTIDKHESVSKFGVNEALGTSMETIWANGGSIYSYPASASIMTLSSSSASDTSAGTGARTVTIYGLDANYAEISETITLNGQTAVNSTLSYLRINRMIVMTAGSGEENAGTIYFGTGTVTTGVPVNKFATIALLDGQGTNQTLTTVYTVPAGKTMYLKSFQVTSGKGKDVAFNLMVRPFGEVFQTKHHILAYQAAVSHDRSSYIELSEKSDIEVRGISDAVATHTSASYESVLVDN